MKNLLSFLLFVTICIANHSCNSDETDEMFATYICTEWNVGADVNITFYNDGTGKEVEGGTIEYFTWQLDDKYLIITYESGEVCNYEIKSISSNEIILIDEYGDVIILTTDKPVNTDNEKTDSDEALDKALFGEWWNGNVLKELQKRNFCSNGTGYDIMTKRDEDYGVKYRSFNWTTPKEGVLSICYTGDTEPTEYNYIIEGKKLKTTYPGSSTKTFDYMGDDVDDNFDATKLPFNNYLKNCYTDYYYEISKFTSGVDHAGSGDNMNEKYLHFFGSDGTLTTTGLRIAYFTPRWDGIDNTWNSGTYKMSSPSGAYKYIAMAWCNGTYISIYDGAILKIKKSGTITTYDFTDDDVELHVNVRSN